MRRTSKQNFGNAVTNLVRINTVRSAGGLSMSDWPTPSLKRQCGSVAYTRTRLRCASIQGKPHMVTASVVSVTNDGIRHPHPVTVIVPSWLCAMQKSLDSSPSTSDETPKATSPSRLTSRRSQASWQSSLLRIPSTEASDTTFALPILMEF